MLRKKRKNIIFIAFVMLIVSITSIIHTSATNEKISSRYEGVNRYLTATSVAEELMSGKFDNVLLASGLDFPDALSGSVLASKVNGPILLVGNSVSNSKVTLDFIKKNVTKNGTIYLLGGDWAVKNEVVNNLKQSGYTNFKRLGGANRYETNLLITNELKVPKGTPVAIASGLDFADAISISGVAGLNQMPIYLVGNDITKEALNKIKEIQPSTIYISGGTGAVNTKIENSLRSITGNIVRFDGKDRYETSLKIAKYFTKNTDTALVAYALDFPDALSGSVLATKTNAPVLLVPAKGNVSKQKEFVSKNNINHIIAIGGEDVVSSQVVNDLLAGNTDSSLKRGLTPNEIEKKLPGLGLSYDASNSGYGIKSYVGDNIGVANDNGSSINIVLFKNTAVNQNQTKQILNWALPTAGNEVYNIISSSFNNQTITRDGKLVELISNSGGISITIYY